MWDRRPAILLLAIAALGACGPAADRTSGAGGTTPAAANVASAERAIRAEQKVRDVRYVAPRWRVVVADDGTRREGYAEYICLVLGQNGARGEGTTVEIVDQADAGRQLGFAACPRA